jgi:mycothiol synthase
MPRALTIDVVDDVGMERSAVEALAERSAPAGHPSALNEAGLLNLRHQREDVRHLLGRTNGDLVGYAQLELGPALDTGQLMVAPEARRGGVGGALLAALLERAEHPLQLWALGDPPAAAVLARESGLERVRALSIMTRALDDDLPGIPPPPGVTIRAFVPGTDENAWLAVNARAFADHPEQGRISGADLAERMAEPWFDPAGFLLAERDGRVIGFHWTKQQAGRLGEVYVIGVDPDAGGGGVGRALLFAGLRHLRERGNTEVELYVESDHERAIRLYTSAGFTESSRDVLYRQLPRGHGLPDDRGGEADVA